MGEEEKTPNGVNTTGAPATPDISSVKSQNISADEMLSLLQEIKKNSELQVKYAKRQSRRSFITALSCFVMMLAVCAAVLVMLPHVNNIFDDVNEVFGDVNIIMNDMKVVTSELAEADFEGMFDGVEDLIVEGSISLTEAMEKIDEIDIEGLNRAIKNLSDAVQPFAAFFGRGR